MVRTLNSSNIGSIVGWRLIREIRQLLALDWEIRICHIYCEANACANTLANMGCDQEPGLHVYEQQCPASLSSLLLMDVMDIATSRVISI
jgi:hypothetical protein